jgi:hypothetical protein
MEILAEKNAIGITHQNERVDVILQLWEDGRIMGRVLPDGAWVMLKQLDRRVVPTIWEMHFNQLEGFHFSNLLTEKTSDEHKRSKGRKRANKGSL